MISANAEPTLKMSQAPNTDERVEDQRIDLGGGMSLGARTAAGAPWGGLPESRLWAARV
jgi:hypothetical protein